MTSEDMQEKPATVPLPIGFPDRPQRPARPALPGGIREDFGVWVWTPPGLSPEVQRYASADQVFLCGLVASDRGWRIARIGMDTGLNQLSTTMPRLMELCALVRKGELDGLLIASPALLPVNPYLCRALREATEGARLEFATAPPVDPT